MAVLVGPCLLAAPLVAIVVLIAIPLWPVVVVLTAVAWCVTWVVERMLTALGIIARARASPVLGRWLRVVVQPWNAFDPPKRDSP